MTIIDIMILHRNSKIDSTYNTRTTIIILMLIMLIIVIWIGIINIAMHTV